MSTASKTRSPAALGAARLPRSTSQFLRFALVGASGYAVNLATFTLLLHGAGLHYRAAAALAFLVAVTSNFVWNRRWTFRRSGAGVLGQAARFLAVSVVAATIGLGLLTALVDLAHVDAVLAQATAIVAVTPLSFLGNRAWTFADRPARGARRRETPGPA